MVDEQRLVQALANEHSIELVITDNRYGSHARGIPNVIISLGDHIRNQSLISET